MGTVKKMYYVIHTFMPKKHYHLNISACFKADLDLKKFSSTQLSISRDAKCYLSHYIQPLLENGGHLPILIYFNPLLFIEHPPEIMILPTKH